MMDTLNSAVVGDIFRVKWHKVKGDVTERELKIVKTNCYNGRDFLVIDINKTVKESKEAFVLVNAKGLRAVEFLRHE